MENIDKIHQIMKEYRSGIKKIDEAYINIPSNKTEKEKDIEIKIAQKIWLINGIKQDISKINAGIKKETEFISNLEQIGSNEDLKLIESAKQRIADYEQDKKDKMTEYKKVEEQINEMQQTQETLKNNREPQMTPEELMKSKVLMPGGREVTRLEKDEMDKRDLQDKARRELTQESQRISKQIIEKSKKLELNIKEKDYLKAKYEFENSDFENSTDKIEYTKQMAKIEMSSDNVKKQLTELNKMQEACNKYLEEFRQMDAKKMETFSTAWNEALKNEQVSKQKKISTEKTPENQKTEKEEKTNNMELNVSEDKTSLKTQKADIKHKTIEGKYKSDKQTKQAILNDRELGITEFFENDGWKLKYLDYSLIKMLKEEDLKLAKDYLKIIRDGGEKNIEDVISQFKEKTNITYKFNKDEGALLNFRAKRVARMAHKLGIAEIEGIEEKGFFEGILSKIKKIRLPKRKEKVEALESGEKKVETLEDVKESKEPKTALEDIKIDNKDNKIEKEVAQMQQSREEKQAQNELKESVNQIMEEETK